MVALSPEPGAHVLNTRAFRIELEFRNVGFCGEGSTRRKTSRSREENQQQTQPTYDVESGNRTRATLVEGECSHHCAIPAPQNPIRQQHGQREILWVTLWLRFIKEIWCFHPIFHSKLMCPVQRLITVSLCLHPYFHTKIKIVSNNPKIMKYLYVCLQYYFITSWKIYNNKAVTKIALKSKWKDNSCH